MLLRGFVLGVGGAKNEAAMKKFAAKLSLLLFEILLVMSVFYWLGLTLGTLGIGLIFLVGSNIAYVVDEIPFTIELILFDIFTIFTIIILIIGKKLEEKGIIG